jgi:hypothetical protein
VVHLGDEVSAELTPATSTVAGAGAAATAPSTQPEAGATTQSAESTTTTETTPTARAGSRVEDILRYVIPVTDFIGIALAVVLAVVLLLIVTIMLVGRLIGVSHVTAAFIWCVVLAALLFPWQAFLAAGSAHRQPAASAYATDTGVRPPPPPDFKIPGVLYTWEEVGYDIRHFSDYETAKAGLKWFRYAIAPIGALFILLMVQAKSSRGLKFALGESEVQVEVTT